MSLEARPENREPAQAPAASKANLPSTSPSSTPSSSLLMPSGRSVAVSSGPAGDQIEVRSPDGLVEIRIALTPQGPVLSVSGAKLEINATESVSLNCRDLAINASNSMNLSSRGSVGIHAAGEIVAKSQGITNIDASVINLNCGDRDGYDDDALPKFELPASLQPPPPPHGNPGCCH